MIIFYNKKTGEIFGTVNGRVHDEDQIKNAMIKPSGVDIEDVGKWVTPFKPVFDTVYEPIIEKQVITTIVKEKVGTKFKSRKVMKVQDVVIGKKKILRPKGMVPDGKFAKFIDIFDKDNSNVYKHRVKISKKGEIEEFIKN